VGGAGPNYIKRRENSSRSPTNILREKKKRVLSHHENRERRREEKLGEMDELCEGKSNWIMHKLVLGEKLDEKLNHLSLEDIHAV